MLLAPPYLLRPRPPAPALAVTLRGSPSPPAPPPPSWPVVAAPAAPRPSTSAAQPKAHSAPPPQAPPPPAPLATCAQGAAAQFSPRPAWFRLARIAPLAPGTLRGRPAPPAIPAQAALLQQQPALLAAGAQLALLRALSARLDFTAPKPPFLALPVPPVPGVAWPLLGARPVGQTRQTQPQAAPPATCARLATAGKLLALAPLQHALPVARAHLPHCLEASIAQPAPQGMLVALPPPLVAHALLALGAAPLHLPARPVEQAFGALLPWRLPMQLAQRAVLGLQAQSL